MADGWKETSHVSDGWRRGVADDGAINVEPCGRCDIAGYK